MKKTVVFKTVNDCEIKGDFYPTTEKKAPILVYIHGGGLIWGSRTDMREEQITFFNEAGFNIISIDYRLAPETKIPAITSDIQDAIIWLQEQGTEQFDYDEKNIGVIGSSAGGYLSLLTGIMKNKPKAIVSLYGYGDITGEWYMKPSSFFLEKPKVPKDLAYKLISSKTISESPIERRYAIYLYCRQQGAWLEEACGMNPDLQMSEIRSLCPVYMASGDYPPTMLLHGDHDTDVPYQESVKMSEKLQELNVENKLITIENADHVFDENWQDPVVARAFQDIVAFLKEKLV